MPSGRFSGDSDGILSKLRAVKIELAKMDKNAMTRLNKFGNKVLSWVARKLLKLKVHDTQC